MGRRIVRMNLSAETDDRSASRCIRQVDSEASRLRAFAASNFKSLVARRAGR